MPPDLVVLAPDRPEVALLVEIKTSSEGALETQNQLKKYMLARRCPLALLVSPTLTTVLKDSYRDSTADTIVVVAELPSSALFGKQLPSSGLELERAVFEWLERLAASWVSSVPADPVAARVVTEHLVPAVSEGRVTFGRAA